MGRGGKRRGAESVGEAFEIGQVFSPEGTAADSLGRQPQENATETHSSPEGAAQTDPLPFLSPLRGCGFFSYDNPWGSRPRLSTVAATRLKMRNFKKRSEELGSVLADASGFDGRKSVNFPNCTATACWRLLTSFRQTPTLVNDELTSKNNMHEALAMDKPFPPHAPCPMPHALR